MFWVDCEQDILHDRLGLRPFNTFKFIFSNKKTDKRVENMIEGGLIHELIDLYHFLQQESATIGF